MDKIYFKTVKLNGKVNRGVFFDNKNPTTEQIFQHYEKTCEIHGVDPIENGAHVNGMAPEGYLISKGIPASK